jgi:hypothetical protein
VDTGVRERMGWIDKRPRDVTSQILEYAESGRLLEGPRTDRDDQRGTIAVIVIATLVLGGGISLAANNALRGTGETVTLIAIMCAIGALAILVPAIRLLRTAPVGKPVRLRPAAMLPPELVRAGNWIHRDGAWLRVEQVGPDGTGRIQARLSSGDIVEFAKPMTIAGDAFRGTSDPVASLRR